MARRFALGITLMFICMVMGVPKPSAALTLTVTNTDDSGPGSLRAALDSANGSLGLDTIEFDIAGSPPYVITLTSPLPFITSPVFIDGWSEPDFTTAPLIVLNGANLGIGSSGFIISTSNSVIRGLVIQNFSDAGILLASTSAVNTHIYGNYIGTNASGTAAAPNLIGIQILTGASGNIIGTNGDGINDALERNIISGNVIQDGIGVLINGVGTRNNRVAGNYIGLNASGTAALQNNIGIVINNGATENIVGTNGDGISDTLERNIISGHVTALSEGIGVQISNVGTQFNRVAGNYIGTDATGSSAIPNDLGVIINTGAQQNIVGTNGDGSGDAAEGNLISGNTSGEGIGVQLRSVGTALNRIAGNFIGTNAAGTAALRNNLGVVISGSAQSNIVGTNGDGISDALERNVISGNTTALEEGLGVQVSGVGTSLNRVAGNYIGTDVTGNLAIGNNIGVVINLGATNNLIGTNGDGTSDTLEGNLISGGLTFSGDAGIGIQISASNNNRVAGNKIGTNAAGTASLANQVGIILNSSAQYNLIGTNGDGVTDNLENNVISGNTASEGIGVQIGGTGTSFNRVSGNYIGTTADGLSALPNNLGVVVNLGAKFNTIGTNSDGFFDPAERNLISGHTVSEAIGIQIGGVGTSFNRVMGNYVGLNLNGAALGNGLGVVVNLGATYNYIGTDGDGANDAAERNIISGQFSAVDGIGIQIAGTGTNFNRVAGNFIGTDPSGLLAVPNQIGVVVNLGAAHNIIGTNADGVSDLLERNIASGNTTGQGIGVQVSGIGTSNNLVTGNYIGINAAGSPLSNHIGVIVNLGASYNVIGTNGDGVGDSIEGNVVCGNTGGEGIGVQISSSGTTNNRVAGNKIGTDATGNVGVSNSIGVIINLGAQHNIIGTNGDGVNDLLERNIISGQSVGEGIGVQISSVNTSNNRIAGNYIGINAAGTAAIRNHVGILINLGATNNLIGTNSDGVADYMERNIISGNTTALGEGVGVQISLSGTSGNRVSGNWIGLNPTNTAVIPNNLGVVINLGASNNIIGTNADNLRDSLERNVISGNTIGVRLGNLTTTGNLVAGNYIGSDARGIFDFGNTTDGVVVSAVGAGNVIGGSVSSAANWIRFNDRYGVQISGADSAVRGNTITSNGRAGIYIKADYGADLSPTSAGDDTLAAPTIGGAGLLGNFIDANCTTGNANTCAGIYAIDSRPANAATIETDNAIGINGSSNDFDQRWYGVMEISGVNGTPISSEAFVRSANNGPTYALEFAVPCTGGLLNNTIIHGNDASIACNDVTTWPQFSEYVVKSDGTRVVYTPHVENTLNSTYSFDANALTHPTDNGEGFLGEGLEAPLGVLRYQVMQGGLPTANFSIAPSAKTLVNGVGKTARLVVAATNIGADATTLRITLVSNSSPSVFSVSGLPLTVETYQNPVTFTVSCVPQSAPQTGSITIQTNEAGRPQYIYHLTCRAAGDTVGVFRPTSAAFYLRNHLSGGAPDLAFTYGVGIDQPLIGDWNGDGIETAGVFRPSLSAFYLRDSNDSGAPDHILSFGAPGDKAVVGDWNGDGVAGIGVFRGGVFYLRNALSDGLPDYIIQFGTSSDLPVIGDWNGDGVDSLGIYRPSAATFFLTNTICTNCAASVDVLGGFGAAGDLPFAGDWNADGISGVGIFRSGLVALRNLVNSGVTDFLYGYGASGDLPVAGVFTVPASDGRAPVFVPRQ